MAKFFHHKYTWSKPWSAVRHNWELVGPDGAINFHVSLHEEQYGGPSCGLEFHRPSWSKRRPTGEVPMHLNCPLTGGPCWHDGTSLYASERLWPMVEPMLRSGDHETIFRVLEGEYEAHFQGRSSDEADAA